jgi:hypothetical protein
MSTNVETIRRLFRNGATTGYALDAREYKRGGNPKNPGQFSSGGASSSAKAEPKPKKAAKKASSEPKAAPAEKSVKHASRPLTELGGSYKSPVEKIKRTQHAERGYTEKELNKAKTTKGLLVEPPKPETKTKKPKAAPDEFHQKLKKLNDYAALNTQYFNKLLGERLGVKVPKGASLSKTIERLKKTHSEADIHRAAQAVANENTRTH